jgi:F-type H+-transporting ATPase subunit c
MDAAAASLIGAGIAAVALGGAGIGLGIFFGHYMEAAMRNPEAQNKVKINPWVAFALIEALGLMGFVLSFILIGQQ